MYIFFIALLCLPLLEIAGFFFMCGQIGIFPSLLWLWGSSMLGLYLLRHGGSGAWRRRREQGDDVFQLQDAFDSLCIMVGALLLIFPGFISDFIALPFLFGPFRHWLFNRVKGDPDSFVRTSYHSWTKTGPRQTSTTTQTIIEGEFKHIDDKPQLPKP